MVAHHYIGLAVLVSAVAGGDILARIIEKKASVPVSDDMRHLLDF